MQKLSENTITLINSNAIETGALYPYSKLMDMLHMPKLSSNSKAAQLAELARYIRWEKINSKYFIEEIYNTPLPEPFYERQSKYFPYIKRALFDILSTSSSNMIIMSVRTWWKQLSMINDNYNKYFMPENRIGMTHYLDMKPLAAFGDAPESTVSHNLNFFYSRTYSQFQKIFERALDKLWRQKFLTYEKCYMISRGGVRRLATPDETEFILQVKNNMLRHFDVAEEQHIYFRSRDAVKEYYDKCNEVFFPYFDLSSAAHDGIYRAIKITFTREGVAAAASEPFEADPNILNELCVEYGYSMAERTRHKICPDFVKNVVDFCIDKGGGFVYDKGD